MREEEWVVKKDGEYEGIKAGRKREREKGKKDGRRSAFIG